MSSDIKKKIIDAGYVAIDQLIKVAREDILKPGVDGDDIAADRLKNAAATKRLAIFDALEILSKIESEKDAISMIEKGVDKNDSKQGFAERFSHK